VTSVFRQHHGPICVRSRAPRIWIEPYSKYAPLDKVKGLFLESASQGRVLSDAVTEGASMSRAGKVINVPFCELNRRSRIPSPPS